VIWGAVADKDHHEVMSLLPEYASYVWCAAVIPRAMEASQVATLRPALSGAVVSAPVEALAHALDAAGKNDVIWVGGSLFVVGDVLRDAPQRIEDWPV
jgi:dihydrofolate synthase/folylpolyglutamate synthase